MNCSNLSYSQNRQLPDNETITGVDVMKYLMAICVVIVHVSAIIRFDPSSQIIRLMRLSVPFFFVSSGWFLAKKLDGVDVNTQKEILLRRTISLLKIFFAWVIIYFPISILEYLDKSNPKNLLQFSYYYFDRLIITGDPPFAWMLWFLHALIIGCFILFLLAKRPILTKVVMGFFICNIFIFWLHETQHITHPYLSPIFEIDDFWGIGIFMSGILLYQKRNSILRINQLLLCCLTAAISLISFYFNLPFWQLLGGIALFFISLNIPKIPLSLASYLRNQSMWIYYLHMFILYFLFYVIEKEENFNPANSTTYFITSCIITLIVSNILGWMNTTRLHRFLNPLIK